MENDDNKFLKVFDKVLDLEPESYENTPTVSSVETSVNTIPATTTPILETEVDTRFEEDWEIARNHLQDIVKTADEAGEYILNFAKSSEKGQDFMAVAALIKAKQQAVEGLLNIHKTKKEMMAPLTKKDEVKADTVNNTQNNIVFNGTPMELRKLLQGK
jgi:hypothetical protein